MNTTKDTLDETFRILKRIPFEEMRHIYISDPHAALYSENQTKYTDELLMKHGWTRNEFIKERLKKHH